MKTVENVGESNLRTSAAFIRAELDDYGLTASQFRVFCRIARRGHCYESVAKIAKGCRLNPDTVSAALTFLCERRLISKTKRPGQTSSLTINPPAMWEPGGFEGVGGKEGCPLVSPRVGGFEGVTTGGNRGGIKLLPLSSSKEGVPLPVFAPVRRGLFMREYDAMIAEAKSTFKKSQEKLTTKVLTAEAISFIEWIEKNETENARAQKIQAAKSDPKNYVLKLSQEGEAHKRCWLARIEEIKRARRGEI